MMAWTNQDTISLIWIGVCVFSFFLGGVVACYGVWDYDIKSYQEAMEWLKRDKKN